jgi:hypothetical protein
MTKKKPPEVFRTKLGPAKQVERSRIWIEGKRLVDAGFMVGQYFVQLAARTMKNRDPSLTLTLLDGERRARHRPVQGERQGRPARSSTSRASRVRDTFGSQGTHVDVRFAKGKITIRPARDA